MTEEYNSIAIFACYLYNLSFQIHICVYDQLYFIGLKYIKNPPLENIILILLIP